jgi:hypothetical protein
LTFEKDSKCPGFGPPGRTKRRHKDPVLISPFRDSVSARKNVPNGGWRRPEICARRGRTTAGPDPTAPKGPTVKPSTLLNRTVSAEARFEGGEMHHLFDRMFNGPIWRTFLLMGVFGGSSAYATYNLLMLFMANFTFISSYGLMGVKEGGLLQLIELIVWGYLGAGFYVLFKGCLYGIIGPFVRH